MRSNRILRTFISLGLWSALLVPVTLRAEDPKPESEGVNQGNYNIKQTIEFGYRFTDINGSLPVYSTFVNLGQGPRLFEHTLQMRSLNHSGALFDDFFMSSFGYGGDANNATRLRMYKNKWYNFSGSFRRDRNFWDYNLLANPLNPPTSNPFVPITFALHRFQTTRRMSDFNLTGLPQSRVRFRLGYSRNLHEGPSFSSFHEGTDILLFQDWKTTVDTYQMGLDIKPSVRTNISYDQFLNYYKGDTSFVDRNLTYQLLGGTPLDLGIIFNTLANQPCAVPVVNASTTPLTASPTCNGYTTYSRSAPVRTSYPTEQLSFQTSEVKNLDLSGRLVYSSAESDIRGLQEFAQGLVTRTRQRQFAISGPGQSKRISATADFAATWHVTSKFRIIDTFRFTSFRLPGQWAMAETSLFGTSLAVSPKVFDPATCPPPFTAAACPQHNSSSPADVSSEVFSRFLGQDAKTNLFELDYAFTKRFGARLGHRFRRRTITHRLVDAADLTFFPSLPNRGACAGQPLLPDGTCHVTPVDEESDDAIINENSLLMGIWTRPTDALRVTFDLEWMSADRAFTRISPRNLQHYKLRTNYKPVHWISLGGSFNILESRDNVTEINHKQHNRSYGFSAAFLPDGKWGLDFGYDYNDVFSATNICFVGTLRPPGTSPCPTSAVFLQQVSLYDNKSHFGYGDFTWRPISRVTLRMGYAIASTNGSTLILTPNAPTGPLRFNYHKPYAGLDFDFGKGFTWKGMWGYYDYNEKSPADLTTAPRDFRGNIVALGVRYSF